MPLADFLHPTLKTPEEVFGFLDACVEESTPGTVGRALCHVIQANRELPFIAYLVVCPYSSHLEQHEISQIVETLKTAIAREHQAYLADLYWWLHTLEEKLAQGVKLVVKVETIEIPEPLITVPEYTQWEKVVAA